MRKPRSTHGSAVAYAELSQATHAAHATCCRAEIAKQIYQGAAGAALQLLLHTGEVNIIQSVCQLFQKLLAAGGEGLLDWEPRGRPAALQTLLQVFRFVLSPDNDDTAAMFVPGLIVQTLQSLRAALADVLPELLQLLVAKAAACDLEALRGALLPVIARCVQAPCVGTCFGGLRIPPGTWHTSLARTSPARCTDVPARCDIDPHIAHSSIYVR